MAPDDAKPTLDTVTESLSCAACHDHNSDLKHKLAVPAADNCIQCHTMGTAELGGSPHHPQGELFLGVGMAGVPESPSIHSQFLNDTCVYCHMYKEGEDVAEVGGHTFLPDVRACEPCHTEPEAMVAAMHADIDGMIARLDASLEAVPEGPDRETAEYQEARFNRDVVAVDASGGTHNYSYAKAGLDHAFKSLGAPTPILYNCETCHAESEEYAEWADTAHAKSLQREEPLPRDSCLICKGASDVKQPANATTGAWAFVVTGLVHDVRYELASPGEYLATVTNLRTGASASDMVGISGDGRFTTAWADLSRRSVVEVGDRVEIIIRDTTGQIVSGPAIHQVTADDLGRALATMTMELGNIIPEKSVLAQNYPNPFNPDTWIPYQLAEEADVIIRIYSASGRLVRALDLNHRNAGTYMSKHRAAYWDGRDDNGESVASGVYVYSIQAGAFTAVRKMVILK